MPVLSTLSRETDEQGFVRSEKFRTERGLELSIEPTPAGLYRIVPHGAGANPPRVCDSLYTSHLKAKEALIEYVASTDRLGYAEYPDKPESKKRKDSVVGKRESKQELSDVRSRTDDGSVAANVS